MILQNELKAGQYRLIFIITLAAMLGFLVFAFVSKENFKSGMIGLGVSALIHVFIMLLKPTYVMYDDYKNPITIKYFLIYPFFRQYKGIAFYKQTFDSFRIEKKFFGFHQILWIKIKGKDQNGNIVEQEIGGMNIKFADKRLVQTLQKLSSNQ